MEHLSRLGKLPQIQYVPIEVVKERYRIVLHYKDPPRIIGTLTRKEIQKWAATMRKKGIPFEVYCEITRARMLGFGEPPPEGVALIGGRW